MKFSCENVVMDKLAPAIDWIKENGFWLANGLLLLLMIGIWFMQTGTLKEELGKNVKKIKGKYDIAKRIMTKKPDDMTCLLYTSPSPRDS